VSVGGCIRYWSEGERNQVLQRYFDGVTVACPVCAQDLRFRMHHTRELVMLSVRCENCGNMAVLLFGGLIGLRAETVSNQI
jgi:predicted RNA-binding Zn-ribbon protein involved in translation (DUF1610 family)